MTRQPPPINVRVNLNTAAITHNLATLTATLTPLATRFAARAALLALLNQDDDAARDRLNGLDAQQLHDIENAAVALSLHASRLRQHLTDQPKDPR